jgi:FHA domain
MAYLVVSMKGSELFRRELSGPVTLGRSTDCGVWINDAGVSRRHCRIEKTGDDAWEVVDLGSRNGVVVHGERVARHTLKDGEAFHIGAARIAFHAVGFVSARPQRPSAPAQGSADSISDTVISNSASRMGRALPTPRAAMPGQSESEATKPAAPLPFTRPPARPIPAPSESPDDPQPSRRNARPQRQGLLQRLLHK